jgi:hypothetical protein
MNRRSEGAATVAGEPTGYGVRAIVRRAVLELVKRSGGTTIGRPRVRSDPSAGTRDEPEPLAGILAAMAVQNEARRQMLESVRHAREDGLSWKQVGAALGYADDPGNAALDPPGERAYRHALPEYRGISPDSFPWECPSCGGQIRDCGPYGTPAETERGHEAGCERLAAAVAAWDARWEEAGNG